MINAEIEKLKLENYVSNSKNLFFSSYNFDLEYIDFKIEEDRNNASVILLENSDVIYNISLEIDKKDPIVTKLRGLEHKIKLLKIGSDWKISSDDYDDLVWKFIHGSGFEINEVRSLIDKNILDGEHVVQTLTTPSCNLPYDETTHDYNRYGAVNYAQIWALGRNPKYFDFVNLDCTNFISQAIHEGSLAAMSDESPSGWFYYDFNNRGVAWTWVDEFNIFTTHEYERDYFYQSGPEGCELSSKYDLRLGDIVQFDTILENPIKFDHSVIITKMEYAYGEYFYYFSAHSDNYLDKPLDFVLTYLDRRFIRIERIDGEIQKVYLPSVIKPASLVLLSATEEGTFTDIDPFNTGYPAPGLNLSISTELKDYGYP